jgi:hypothetical protein
MDQITMKLKLIISLAALLTLTACFEAGSSADVEQAKQTAQMQQAANQSVGMPNIKNWTEKRFAKLIYELKDQEVTTYSYFMDMNGGLHLLCESVGYGLSASVQYSNPEKVVRKTSGTYGTLPQPEPNGLFMPEGLAATFVLCSDGKGGVRPIYSEPELIVSPFKLAHKGSLKKS